MNSRTQVSSRVVGIPGMGLFLLFLAACASTRLEIDSTPQGATVSRAEQILGRTPLSVDLGLVDERHVDLVFRRQGYEPKRLRHELVGNPSYAHVELERLRTALEISTSPASAEIALSANGQAVLWEGHASVYGDQAAALALNSDELWGRASELELEISITAPGYVPQTRTIPIARGTRHTLSFVLAESGVRIEITSEPEGAHVHDRRLGFLGTTPLTKSISRTDLIRIADDPEHVDQGTRLHLTVTKLGYRQLETSMLLTLIDEVQSLTLALERAE